MKKMMMLAVALFAAVAILGQAPAQAGGRNTGAIVGGVAAGVVGGLLLGNALNQPAYAAPPPAYYVAPRPAYVEEEVVPVPRCVIRRVPLYDEDGDIVGYRNRRVCR